MFGGSLGDQGGSTPLERLVNQIRHRAEPAPFTRNSYAQKKKHANKSVNLQVLPLVHPNAAGIDVGAKEHVVAVPCDRDSKPIRTFQAFTPELHELAAWLKRCGIQTVALESTGIYWISLYEVLEQYGFEIRVVNARRQARARPNQNRRPRLPVDSKASQLRPAQRIVSP